MSEILNMIKDDLFKVMKEEITLRKSGDIGEANWEAMMAQKDVSRAILSMFPEIGKKPSDATDDDTIKLLKKYISQEKERELYIQKHLTEIDVDGVTPGELKKLVNIKLMALGDELTSYKIMIAQKYLPKQATEEEIIQWIADNLDLSSYNNKMQAMKPIMQHFQGCDGNFVKSILLKL